MKSGGLMFCCICGLESFDGFDHQECEEGGMISYSQVGDSNDDVA